MHLPLSFFSLPVSFPPRPLSHPLLLYWTTPLCFLLSWRVVGVHEQARWWDQLSISSHKSIDLTPPRMSLCTASLFCPVGLGGNQRLWYELDCVRVKCSSRALKCELFKCVCKRECECASSIKPPKPLKFMRLRIVEISIILSPLNFVLSLCTSLGF